MSGAAITTLGAARGYHRRGWAVIPVPPRKKGPRILGWTSLRLTENNLQKHFSNGTNIGVLLGAASGGLVDIDLDSPEARKLAPIFLPRTELVHGRPGNPASHFWYRTSDSLHPQKYSDCDGKTLVEIRSDGQQTVVPPSIHPTGEHITWAREGEPSSVSVDALGAAVAKLAAAALLARNWPERGARHDAAMALAGMLLRGGWTEENCIGFVQAVALAAGDEEMRHRKKDVISTVKRLAAGGMVTGAPSLANLVSDKVVQRVSEIFQLNHHRQPSDGKGTRHTTKEIQFEWPEPPPPEAFHGLAGKVVQAIEPHSEADPAALLVQFLMAFGNIVGRSAYYCVEDTQHHTNIFAVIVGETAKSRKGTSWGRIRNLFGELEPHWLWKVRSGLSTGEGLIWYVRDPFKKRKKPGKTEGKSTVETTDVDEGVKDKRLSVVEEEFSLTLRVMERQGATLSAVLRDAWDTGNLSSLTKNSPAHATGAHISILGHITRQELKRYLTETEYANGFGNRFLWVCAKRSKCLPDGGALDKNILQPLIRRLQKALSFANKTGKMLRDHEARKMWDQVYPELSEGLPGLLGSITSRAEAQVLRLSMIYALLDCSQIIRVEHLKAALAVWKYCMASAEYIFGDDLGLPEADEILRALRESPEGLARSDISALFRHHKTAAQIQNALAALKERRLVEMRLVETNGRSAEVWEAVPLNAKEAKKAK
jgi:hypothetical protein